MKFEGTFDFNTSIVGVIGHPIQQSYSPFMHNTSFTINGENYIYLPFDVPASNLKDALRGMLALNIKGFNVTIPLKEKIAEYLNEISEEAGVIGAINTVVNESGVLHGYNTDVYGITETLEPYREELNGAEVSVIGAGGASRSAIYALIRNFKPSRINIINRTVQKAESLKDYFTEKMLYENIKAYELFPPDIVDVFRRSKCIINSTSIGMYPDIDDSPTEIEDSFLEGQIVFDMVYNPLKTRFLQLAEQKGAIILNGLKMFVNQGAKSYEMWTGGQMPIEEIEKALKEQLSLSNDIDPKE